MLPSTIAQITKNNNIKKIILSHRMKRTIGYENETLKILRKKFSGEIIFAEDRMKVLITK